MDRKFNPFNILIYQYGDSKISPYLFFWNGMTLTTDEVWLRSFEAIISAARPRSDHSRVLDPVQIIHAIERADNVVEAFKERFCDREDQ